MQLSSGVTIPLKSRASENSNPSPRLLLFLRAVYTYIYI